MTQEQEQSLRLKAYTYLAAYSSRSGKATPKAITRLASHYDGLPMAVVIRVATMRGFQQ